MAKLLKFFSSNDSEKQTTLSAYVERMKEKQEAIYYVAGSGRDDVSFLACRRRKFLESIRYLVSKTLKIEHEHLLKVENSPFVERLLKKGFEVLYLTEPVDEYCIQAMPEFDGKKFQNVAKEVIPCFLVHAETMFVELWLV